LDLVRFKVYYLCETLVKLVRKFFPLDKNYILEQAQFRSKQYLLSSLYQLAARCWTARQNPMGLQDQLSEKVMNYCSRSLDGLNAYYELTAAVYRFRHGSNQLELIWDGTDTADRYAEEWEHSFLSWSREYCKDPIFFQSILDLTVFLDANKDVRLLSLRMQRFLLSRFELRYSPAKGLISATA